MLERLQGVAAPWTAFGSTTLVTTAAGADEIAARFGVIAVPHERPGLRARRVVIDGVEVLGDVQYQLPGGRWTIPPDGREWLAPTPSPPWTLRPLGRPDFEWAYALHREVLGEYVDATWGWKEADQRRRVAKAFDHSPRDVIEIHGRAQGVVGVDDRPGELYLELIELLPEAQGHGLGTTMLRALIRYARDTDRALSLHVIKANPRARALYEREGLRVVVEDDATVRMRTDVRG